MTSAAADVEIVDERDKNQGMASANDAVGSKTANTTGNSAGDAATEKDAIKTRLGKLHCLLNSRIGSLSATYKKNAEANDKAYDLNQKTIQALDALAADYIVFEAAMANVTRQEMRYTQRPQRRLVSLNGSRRIRADCRMTWTV